MTNSGNQMDVLTELLTERGRYQTWLSQLERRRETTPLHVLERVRVDYAARLETVTAQLRGRAVELDRSVSALRSRLSALKVEEDRRRDERAETELRAAVGEFLHDHAGAVIAECDAAISVVLSERDALATELARLEEVLRQVMASPAPGIQEAEVEQSLSALDPVVVAPAPLEPGPSAMDELAFLRSVVSPESSLAIPVPAPARPASDAVQPAAPAAPRRQATPLSSAVPTPRSVAPATMPSFLRDVPTEQVKTLKCAECGTMNSPTEWYCERCGGELAAM